MIFGQNIAERNECKDKFGRYLDSVSSHSEANRFLRLKKLTMNSYLNEQFFYLPLKLGKREA